MKGDSEKPIEVHFEDICAAEFRIRKGVKRTTCLKSNDISRMVGMEIFFKNEYLQHTGSFKERGALNTLLLLSKEQKRRGVIAASAGNHAQALAYHGNKLKIPVTVVMPENAPLVKQTMCREYGATIILKGHHLVESKEYALDLADQKGLAYINGYDHPHILSGQGTVGLEIIDQVYPLDAVIVPVGGGGLLAGIAIAVKTIYPHVKIIAAESERCASFKAAMEAGAPVKVEAHHSETLADGLCVPQVGSNAFANAKDLVNKVIVVSEDFIGLAILHLIELEKSVVEGAGATGLAAVLSGQLPELKGKR
ncbi:predicted protein [Nematostella vectensis]|uniref:Serine racemase n=1 Tax=Nematostella vectensis TaxID=45351 RepID=A7RTQ7_NEMVE|nr:predicted protein [Nematostella vectensis]|eukprot:XP_001637194.1 predicted protein [Nematostella vectensis]